MTTYINGTSPNFLGATFTSSTDLLTLIRDTLLGENWVTVTDDIANRLLLMKGITTQNNHECWIKFVTSVVSGTQEQLTIYGDQTGANTILSAGFYLYYYTDNTNYLYLTCDNDSGAISTIPYILTSQRSVYFGFYNRVSITNAYAWGVGYIHAGYNNHSIAKHPHTGGNWALLHNDYFDSLNTNTVNQCKADNGVLDRYTTCLKPMTSPGNNIASNEDGVNKYNQGYLYYSGALNALNNSPVLGEMYLQWGVATDSAYLTSLYFLGTIKHCVVGMCSMGAGVQVIDSLDRRYLSAGTSGSPGWLGMRIK
jgi:hypothetical protein